MAESEDISWLVQRIYKAGMKAPLEELFKKKREPNPYGLEALFETSRGMVWSGTEWVRRPMYWWELLGRIGTLYHEAFVQWNPMPQFLGYTWDPFNNTFKERSRWV